MFKESSKPSPTDVISYWNKPRLSKVSSTSFARTSDFGEVSCPTDIDVAEFFAVASSQAAPVSSFQR